jgi:hypothetical protein
MRSVLYIAIAMLLVALGLQNELGLPASAGNPVVEVSESEPHAVTIFSTGWNLQLPVYGQREIYKGFLIDSVEMDNGDRGIGLSIVELPAAGSPSAVHHFDLRNNIGDAIRLIQFLDVVELGTVLVMGSNTTIGLDNKTPDSHHAQVHELYRRMGALSEPARAPVQSFAYICMQTESGFQAVAETYSTTRGVSLSYLVPSDRSLIHGVKPLRLHDARTPLPLVLDAAISDSFVPAGERQFGQHILEHLGGTVTEASTIRATWELGEDSYDAGEEQPTLFQSKIAMGWVANNAMLGVRFILRVNDLWVGDRVLLREPGDAARWRHWEEPIPTHDGGTQRLRWSGSAMESARRR